MSRRRRQGLSPTLFPFLAVLVCTLGTLILLLALVAQNASETAEMIAEQPPEVPELEVDFQPLDPARPTVRQIRDLVGEETFRLEALVSFRDAQTGDLEDRRDRLAHVEDHMRRIRQKLKSISDAMELAMSDEQPETVSEQELAELRKEVDEKGLVVKKLRDDISKQRPRVVIVPHQGPNGTSRRPIYIECTKEGVTLWPEEISITRAQLEDSTRDANPLSAALRAVRYHVTHTYGSKTPPYPMLIVRPDGVESYYAARLAMSDWDDQFGYELVPSGVNLAYQTPDLEMRERVDYAVKEALRLQTSISVASALGTGSGRFGGFGPSSQSGRYQPSSPPSSPSSRQGRVGGTAQKSAPRSFPKLSASQMDRQGRRSGFRDHRSFARPTYGRQSGNSYGSGQSISAEDAKRRLEQSLQTSNELLAQTDTDSGLDEATRKAIGESAGSGGGPQGFGETGFELPAGPYGNDSESDQRDSLAQSDGKGTLDEQAQSAANAPNQEQSSEQLGMVPGGQHTSGTTGRRSSNTHSSAATRENPKSGFGSGSSASSSRDQSMAQSQGQRSPQGGKPSGSSQPPPPPGASAGASQPMVNRDRADWALPRNVALSSGNDVIRSIRVQVSGDRFVLLPGARNNMSAQSSQTFVIENGDVDRATLQLAAAIRGRVESWGAALPGGRWAPRLQVEVMPGAEQRFGQLQQLMSGSGLEIQTSPYSRPTYRQATQGPTEMSR